MQEVLIKLKALRTRCDKLFKFYHSSVPKIVVENIFRQFIVVREILHKDRPDLFEGYELQDYKKYDSVIGKDCYLKIAVKAIIDDISFYIDILQGLETVSIPNFKFTNEGIYFSGQYFEALSKLIDIIKTAKTDIILIDGYIDEKNLKLFTSLQGKIKIRILTKKNSLTPAFKTLVDQFNKQYGDTLEVKTSEKFHDRFIILDKNEFYHIGASIKDAGNRGFMFSRIEEQFIQNKLLEEFDKYW